MSAPTPVTPELILVTIALALSASLLAPCLLAFILFLLSLQLQRRPRGPNGEYSPLMDSFDDDEDDHEHQWSGGYAYTHQHHPQHYDNGHPPWPAPTRSHGYRYPTDEYLTQWGTAHPHGEDTSHSHSADSSTNATDGHPHGHTHEKSISHSTDSRMPLLHPPSWSDTRQERPRLARNDKQHEAGGGDDDSFAGLKSLLNDTTEDFLGTPIKAVEADIQRQLDLPRGVLPRKVDALPDAEAAARGSPKKAVSTAVRWKSQTLPTARWNASTQPSVRRPTAQKGAVSLGPPTSLSSPVRSSRGVPASLSSSHVLEAQSPPLVEPWVPSGQGNDVSSAIANKSSRFGFGYRETFKGPRALSAGEIYAHSRRRSMAYGDAIHGPPSSFSPPAATQRPDTPRPRLVIRNAVTSSSSSSSTTSVSSASSVEWAGGERDPYPRNSTPVGMHSHSHSHSGSHSHSHSHSLSLSHHSHDKLSPIPDAETPESSESSEHRPAAATTNVLPASHLRVSSPTSFIATPRAELEANIDEMLLRGGEESSVSGVGKHHHGMRVRFQGLRRIASVSSSGDE